MLKLDFDEALIDQFATKVANKAFEKLSTKIDSLTGLPPLLTKKQLEEFFQISHSTASLLLNRDDFPVIREVGVRVPTHLLIKWIEKNTKWVQENTDYFPRRVI
jgi:hypothetical protein